MSFVQHIAIPSFVEIERGCLIELPAILARHHLRFNTFSIVSGNGPTTDFADRVAESLQGEHLVRRAVVTDNTTDDVDRLIAWLSRHPIDVVVAVGGGRVLDVAKSACGIRRAPLILVPTSVSSDSIASPVAVIKHDGRPRSMPGQPPIGVVVDMTVMAQTPLRLLKAGVGDLMSNLSAAFDWRLARDHRREAHNAATETMARLPAERMLQRASGAGGAICIDESFMRELAEGLVLSGMAMSLAGNSRPCSGSEHMISHALDQLRSGECLHGEQVLVATVFTLQLQGQCDLCCQLREFAAALGMPRRLQDIGLSEDVFLKAVRMAPSTRPGRFSILDLRTDEISWQSACRGAFPPDDAMGHDVEIAVVPRGNGAKRERHARDRS